MLPRDREECMFFGRDPVAGLAASLKGSDWVLTVAAGDEVVAMVGLAPYYNISGVGCPWMLCTTLAPKHPRALYRACKQILLQMLEEYGMLVNKAWAGNEHALDLVRHLGFTVLDPHKGVSTFFKKRADV